MFTIKSMNELNIVTSNKLDILQIYFDDMYHSYSLLVNDNYILAQINSTKDFDEKSEEFIKLDTLRNSILKELDDYESRAVSSESRHFKINRKFELERINL